MHAGQDSEFYLRKGFRVIGVDADEAMCQTAAERLRAYVATGQLEIVNIGISDRPGETTLYRNTNGHWSTLVPAWRDQNAARGWPSTCSPIEAITLAELVRRHGPAFYIKLDIEGMDLRALQTLNGELLPTYVSIESAFPRDASFQSMTAELKALAQLGYDRFKIVPQHQVEHQTAPDPPLIGNYAAHRFEPGSSGLFGDEAPGDWLSLHEALAEFRCIVRRSWWPVLLHKRIALYDRYCRLMKQLTGVAPDVGWYDIHATVSG